MKKLFSLTLLATVLSLASFAQVLPIFGVSGTCVSSGSYLYDSTVGGTWSSSDDAIGSITSLGFVAGISAGTCTITYTVGASYATYGYTVSPAPSAISGPDSVCVGSVITLSDTVSGGVWSTLGTTIGTIGSSTGVVTGVSSGTVSIEYTTGPSCYALLNVHVGYTTPPAAISGASTVCVGSVITLSDATTGGVWSSSAPSVATVGSGTGVVTGVMSGADSIYYTITSACGSAYASKGITVGSTVSAGTISGATTVTVGGFITLTDGVSGGTWSSSSTAIATVSGGVVTGVATGVVTISYSVTGCGGTAVATTMVTVDPAVPLNRISGNINFGSGPVDSTGPVKVWLITLSGTTLAAVDSETLYTGDTSVYYQFLGAATDSYRVKAAYFPATFDSIGYMPTYHTSSPHWNTADVIYHTTGTTDDGKDINMGYGTVTSGPGFIAGDVTLGADKGTSTIPSIGLLIYALNSTGAIVQQTYTNTAGHYSFGNLPVGATYTIYPEALNYATTAYTGISLTTSSPTMSTASFGQHSLSLTILPITTSVKNITSSVSSVIAFPNPTNGKLNIQWNESTTEKANVSITDITGREVYSSAINMNQGSGSAIVNIEGLTNGVYLLNIKSGTINYNNKIQLQR